MKNKKFETTISISGTDIEIYVDKYNTAVVNLEDFDQGGFAMFLSGDELQSLIVSLQECLESMDE